MARWPPQPCPGADVALLEMLAECPPSAELDFGELFAGEGSVSGSMAALGYRGRALDRDHQAAMDLLQPLGFLMAMRVALSIKPGGVMWLAPPCSSWVFLTRHSSGRDIVTEGDVTQAGIVAQNALLERVVCLLELLSIQGAYWIVEQPASSVLWDYPSMRACLQRHGLKAPCIMDMGAYGGSSQKPTHLWGTAPYLPKLARRCDADLKLRLRMEGVQTTKRTTDASGTRRCQGTSDLKATQAYPWGWGAAHALAFQDHYGPSRCTRDTVRSAGMHVAAAAMLQEQLPGFRDAWYLRDFQGERW